MNILVLPSDDRTSVGFPNYIGKNSLQMYKTHLSTVSSPVLTIPIPCRDFAPDFDRSVEKCFVINVEDI